MTHRNDVVDIIEKAIEIVQNGWTQGTAHTFDEDGNYLSSCALGALTRAETMLGVYDCNAYHDAVNILDDMVCAMDRSDWVDVGPLVPLAIYNDQPWVTVEDVVSLFKEAANKEAKNQ